MQHPIYKTIKGRFLIVILILMLAISIGATTVSFLFFYNNLRTKEIQSTETNLNFLADSINQKMDRIFSFSEWCKYNTNILRFVLTAPDESEMGAYNSATGTAKDLLLEEYLYNGSKKYMQRVVVANHSRKDYLQYVDASYSIDRPMVQIITDLPYYQEYMDAPSYLFSYGFQEASYLRIKNVEMLPIIRPIFHPYKKDCIGFVYIEVAPTLFLDSVNDYVKHESVSLFLSIGNVTYEFDGEGCQPITVPKISVETRYHDIIERETTIYKTTVNGHSQLILTRPLTCSDCYISQVISPITLNQQLTDYLFILIIIVLCIILIGFILYYSLTRTVTLPILQLCKRIQLIAQGDFTKDPAIEWNNELGDMGKNVNQLAKDIEQLMEQRIKDERQKKDYEYQILQSQIKPHFIYNTLNSIKWMATIQQVSGIAEMVTALSHLLKSIAKGTSTFVTIRDEIELLNDYFIIQKYRSGGSVTLSYIIDEERIYECRILRFTLQPIVENAIFHGIEPKGRSGSIQIHILPVSDTDIRIDITDDGVGMDKGLIQRVLSGDTQANSHVFRDIGIYNVNKRLQYTFGNNYGISIESIVGEYTTMSILLPYTTEKKEETDDDEIIDCR